MYSCGDKNFHTVKITTLVPKVTLYLLCDMSDFYQNFVCIIKDMRYHFIKDQVVILNTMTLLFLWEGLQGKV